MRGPPRSTRTDPLFPYPPLFRSLPRRGALPLLIPSATGPMGPQSPAGDCGLLFGAWGAPAASFAGRGLRGALAFALAVLALARPRRLAALQPALDHAAVDLVRPRIDEALRGPVVPLLRHTRGDVGIRGGKVAGLGAVAAPILTLPGGPELRPPHPK